MFLEVLCDVGFQSFIICKKYFFIKKTRRGETSPTTNDGLFKMLVAYFERGGGGRRGKRQKIKYDAACLFSMKEPFISW